MFRHAPSRSGRGRRVAVGFVVCLGWGGFFRVFFFSIFVFFFSNAHGLLQGWRRLASFTSLLVLLYVGLDYTNLSVNIKSILA